MANYDRERDERVFDGGEDEDDGEGSHLPVVIIIAILVLAAFGGVVWLAYNQGVARGRDDVQPRMAAVQPSGTDGAGLKVYSQPAADEDEKPASAPSSAEPMAAVPASGAPAVPPQAAPVSSAPEPHPAISAPAPSQTPAAAAPVARQVMRAAEVAPPPAAATKPPAQLGLAHPAPVAAPPQKAAAPVATVAAKPTAKASGGSYLLQIGAYKSETEAMNAWKIYQSKHAALLNGFGPDVQRADLGDKGTWYRLRIASFADKDAASALCDRLKAQNANCFLAH